MLVQECIDETVLTDKTIAITFHSQFSLYLFAQYSQVLTDTMRHSEFM